MVCQDENNSTINDVEIWSWSCARVVKKIFDNVVDDGSRYGYRGFTAPNEQANKQKANGGTDFHKAGTTGGQHWQEHTVCLGSLIDH